jgi:hypothetical protein
MENYKSLEAWKFFQDGWVQTIFHMKVCQDVIILKCDVRPSYRTTSPNHKPWVALDSLGKVLTAHCDCMAGYVSFMHNYNSLFLIQFLFVKL